MIAGKKKKKKKDDCERRTKKENQRREEGIWVILLRKQSLSQATIRLIPEACQRKTVSSARAASVVGSHTPCFAVKSESLSYNISLLETREWIRGPHLHWFLWVADSLQYCLWKKFWCKLLNEPHSVSPSVFDAKAKLLFLPFCVSLSLTIFSSFFSLSLFLSLFLYILLCIVHHYPHPVFFFVLLILVDQTWVGTRDWITCLLHPLQSHLLQDPKCLPLRELDLVLPPQPTEPMDWQTIMHRILQESQVLEINWVVRISTFEGWPPIRLTRIFYRCVAGMYWQECWQLIQEVTPVMSQEENVKKCLPLHQSSPTIFLHYVLHHLDLQTLLNWHSFLVRYLHFLSSVVLHKKKGTDRKHCRLIGSSSFPFFFRWITVLFFVVFIDFLYCSWWLLILFPLLRSPVDLPEQEVCHIIHV